MKALKWFAIEYVKAFLLFTGMALCILYVLALAVAPLPTVLATLIVAILWMFL